MLRRAPRPSSRAARAAELLRASALRVNTTDVTMSAFPEVDRVASASSGIAARLCNRLNLPRAVGGQVRWMEAASSADEMWVKAMPLSPPWGILAHPHV